LLRVEPWPLRGRPRSTRPTHDHPDQEHRTMTAEIRDPVSRVRQTFQIDGESLVVDNWLEPGGALPAHYHPRQEERWSVLEGQVRFRHGDEERVIGPQDGEIVVAPGDVHAVTSSGDREAHLRCYVTPPLRLQQLLEEAAAAAQQGLFTQRGRPRGLRGARWAAGFLKRYRDDIVFLSPPAIVQRLLIALLARDT
jgi:quercetin dioxygenase-like cupin family protein